LEFVEGETRAAKLARGKPPLDATLLMGSEISEGLSAAHARGVVHRDIKPSNLMVTPHGHVKILDYGLAHSVDIDGGKTTETAAMSGSGSPAYMSPEQARGQDVTPASDLFSLGAVLYECLAGRLPFEGATGYEYVGNVLTGKPVPLAPLAPDAPFALVQLVERCLEKDPGWRPDSADAVSRELRLLLEAGARGAAASTVARWSSSRMKQTTAAAIAIGLFALAAVSLGSRYWRDNEALEAPRETVPVVTWPSAEEGSRVSPDGRWISFLSDRDGVKRVYVQPIDGGDARVVDVDGEVIAHVWSPDGRQIACYVATSAGAFVQVVPAFFGGAVQTSVLIDTPVTLQTELIRWIGDALYMVTDSASGKEGRKLIRLALADGSQTDATPQGVDPSLQIRWFDVHPVNGTLVFSAVKNQREDLWISDADGARTKQITDDDDFERYPVWTGDIVTFQSNRGGQIDLWQIDPASGRTRLISSSETEERPESATADGAMLTFSQDHANARLWKLHAGGRIEPLTNDALSDFAPSASRDGRTVLFQRQTGSPALGATLLDSQLFIMRGAGPGGAAVSLSVPAGFFPQVSPDGSRVAFFGRQSSGSIFASLFVKDLATGQVRTISNQCPLPGFVMTSSEWIQQLMTWHPDGRLFFVEQSDAGALVRRFDPRDGSIANLTGLLQRVIMDLRPSPDGTALAYRLAHERTYQVRRRNITTGDDVVVHQWDGRPGNVSIKGWTPDGALVIVRRHGGVTESDPTSMEVALLTSGREQRVAMVPGALAYSARLGPGGATLYFAGTEARAANIYALTLPTGAIAKLTANQLTSVVYSGIEPLADGSVIYAQNERRHDIWLSRTTSPRSDR
jgi:Tol biopolymer transport system component